MIDIHTHILPGLDDGAEDIYDSLEMGAMAQEHGTKVIVATPHCNIPGLYSNYFGEHYKEAFLKTRKEDGRLIEFANESYGVRKLIMLSMYFPLLFINPYITLVIDEIDEGIFEFLLGKILEAIYKYGVGQLIFTAHNLRPLEILPHKCIRFAIPYELNSKNVKNRYRKLKCTNKDSMLRDVYYRMFSPSYNEQIESMGTMED